MAKEIIGLSGYARSGKDEAAKVLVEEYGFTRVAFADKLREVLLQLNPIVSHTAWAEETIPVNNPAGREYVARAHPVYLSNVIDSYGWDGYKETVHGTEIRRLLQRLGTEAGRQTLWDTIWIDAAFNGVESDKIVVTDARFFNEFDAVRDRGGSIWRIEREGIGPANDHPSETEAVGYPHFDYLLHNNGHLDEWAQTVKDAYKDWLENKESES